MNRHPQIIFDFVSKVKLTSSEEKKLNKWLALASEVIGESLADAKFIHHSWVKSQKNIRVSLLLCGERRMKKINLEHRQKDYATDVLSFPAFETLRTKAQHFQLMEHELFLGDLVICHQKIISQAKEFKISYWDEFIHLLFHGIIHLVGYDHEISEKEEKLMSRWEDQLLSNFSQKKGAR